MRDHKKLRAFELADQLAMLTYKQTATLPKDELFGLVSQMRRAAISVASNIVEGCSRSSTVEYVRFLEVAYGSARELEYQISVAERLYVDCVSSEWQSLATETCKVLNGLVRSLKDRES
ncbi:MAG: four helix bundle protein [Planctomycetaceae bacterium]|nr:four helix bundle protein [Planctomycetaceae bacterium]